MTDYELLTDLHLPPVLVPAGEETSHTAHILHELTRDIARFGGVCTRVRVSPVLKGIQADQLRAQTEAILKRRGIPVPAPAGLDNPILLLRLDAKREGGRLLSFLAAAEVVQIAVKPNPENRFTVTTAAAWRAQTFGVVGAGELPKIRAAALRLVKKLALEVAAKSSETAEGKTHGDPNSAPAAVA